MSKVIPLADPFDEMEYYGNRQIRWYQIAVRHQSVSAVIRGIKRILVILPTGTGKTLAIACTVCSAEMKNALGVPAERKLRVMFISHVHRLLTQADRTFAEENGVELILQSAMSAIPDDVINEGWDITVLDEAHHEAMASMQYQLDTILGDIPLIGLTATPDRADGMVIKFEEFINPISREQAVDEGWLAETNLHTIVDGSERSKADIICDILDAYSTKMEGTLIFVRTKREIGIIQTHLTKLGYNAVGLLNQSPAEIDRILDSFSEGEIQYLISCNRLGEGIDVVGCHTVILGRTIGSYSLLNQFIGRGARPDCECNIYEIVNPLSKANLDTTCVVGTPKVHILIYYANHGWQEEIFDYAA